MAGKALVVCYSRGGTTLRVASYLAEALGGEVDRIEEVGSRSGVAGYLRSGFEALAKGLPAIGTRRDPRQYDLVVIGSPVWAGTMCSPVRSYIFSHPRELGRAAFFAVMGGRGGAHAIREMQLAAGAVGSPSCVLTQSVVEGGLFQPQGETFVKALKDWASGRSRPSPARDWPRSDTLVTAEH